MTTTTNKTEFMDALRAIFNAYDGDSSAPTRTAWHLAGAVADGLMPLECAENLMQKIGKEITRSNDYHYNCGYTRGYNDAEEEWNVFNCL